MKTTVLAPRMVGVTARDYVDNGCVMRTTVHLRQMQIGISLIEMLVALLIIAVGLLGVAGLQAYSLKNNTSAYHRSQATALIYDIFDAMRTNRQVALAEGYEATGTGTRAIADLASWRTRLEDTLPGGDGEIACGAASGPDGVGMVGCTVTVRWNDYRTAGTKQAVTVSALL